MFMLLMAIDDVNRASSVTETPPMFTLRDGPQTIIKLDHRSIELADHTQLD